MFIWHAQGGRIEQEEVIKGGQKRPFLGPTSPPNCPVACPHATTSITLNLNLVLSSVYEERRSCRRTQAPLLFLRTLCEQSNISSITASLPWLIRSPSYMVLPATR